jgi:hypothetical protein
MIGGIQVIRVQEGTCLRLDFDGIYLTECVLSPVRNSLLSLGSNSIPEVLYAERFGLSRTGARILTCELLIV